MAIDRIAPHGSEVDSPENRRRLAWPPDRPSAGIRVVLLAAWLFVVLVAVISAGASPLIRAADAAQYGTSTLSVETCYADLTSPRPRCPYVKPALTGANLPILESRDPGQIAADALSMNDIGLVVTADRLISTQRDGAWLYLDDVRLANSTLHAPWISASAQGLGISVLARAWTITSDDKYRVSLIEAAMAIPTSPDGWPATLPDGSHALTGGLNGLLGLWDAWRVTHDPVVGARFGRALDWLESNIQRYDRDSIVLYALGPYDDPTSRDLLYHSIAQLSVISAATGREVLAATAREWEWRRKNPGAFRLNLYVRALANEPAARVALASLAVMTALVARRVTTTGPKN
jgi:hypothetical protein